MAGFKITSFLGKAPKTSSELLPDTAAQIAENCKLYSGDLIPYPQPVLVANTGRTGTIKTLYALRNPNNPNDLKWLSWATDVDIAVASANLQDEQRFYYTGDGAPKISTYELATTGVGPYPIGFYDLGLPLPSSSTILTTTAATFTSKNAVIFSRDAGNVATITTSANHGLRTGNIITVSGFTFISGTYNQPGTTTITVTINAHGLANGATVTLDFTSGNAVDGTFTITNVTTNTFDIIVSASATTSGDVNLDVRSFNASNVECTVVNAVSFTYFSPGFEITPYSLFSPPAGKVDLGGLTQARSYVFTWYTPWEEESIASRPSANLFIKEGVTVTVSSIPTAKPAGNNFVRGVRLYRTLPSASGTEYFLLSTLWFPTALSSVQRTANVSRVTLAFPHNLGIDDRFKISGCTVASFNITGGIVDDIIDDYTFEYVQTAANVALTTVSAGTLFHDVSENPPTTSARYWGDAGNFNFIDDFDSRTLLRILESDDYDAPPDNLQGLVNIQNNILVGFVGNTLYFSEPDLPHAWPAAYATPVGEDIVALAAISGALLVLTKRYPYIITVTDPASGISQSRIDSLFPCLSANSVVTMEYGVVWSTNDGLAVYSPSSGPVLVTKTLYNNDTWRTSVDPQTVIAEYYGENYIASHSQGAFVFEQDTKVGGFFVDVDLRFTASWYDAQTGRLYYVADTTGDVYEWDNLVQPPLTMEWKSKTIISKEMMNLGAARVVADYVNTTSLWDATTVAWESALVSWSSSDAATFRLWVDKQLIFTTTLNDSGVFRLPTGYRSDTFEIGVESSVRVRAIHIAETSFGLREV
jgi:hypothetical protein